MSPSNALFSIVLCAATLLGATPATASTTASQCEQLLTELDSKQDTLSQLEKAVAEGRARQDGLLVQANDLGYDIANQLSEGAVDADMQTLIDDREELFVEIDSIETTLNPIELQIDALSTDVDSTSRGYIACIESTIG